MPSLRSIFDNTKRFLLPEYKSTSNNQSQGTRITSYNDYSFAPETLLGAYQQTNSKNLFQGPVPQGADEDLYRSTGQTKPLGYGGGGTSSVGVTGAGGSADQASKVTADSLQQKADDQLANRKKLEGDRLSEGIDRIGQGISEIFAPQIQELDRQLGFLPDQRGRLEDRVSGYADEEGQLITSQEQGLLSGLTQTGEKFKTEAKGSLRDIADNIRNSLDATSRYFGSLGAGDSSSSALAATILGREGAKQRGKVQGSLTDSLKEIDFKKAEVSRLAGEQRIGAERAKNDRLNQIGQWYEDNVNRLNQLKAQLTGEERSQVFNAEEQLRADAINELRRLDDDYTNFTRTLDNWQLQRQAAFDDYARAAVTAANTAGTEAGFSTDVKRAFDVVNQLIGNGWDPNQALQAVQQSSGIDLRGYFPTTEDDIDRIRQVQLQPSIGSVDLGQQKPTTSLRDLAGSLLGL